MSKGTVQRGNQRLIKDQIKENDMEQKTVKKTLGALFVTAASGDLK